jgi:uncharacterized protein YjcR
MTDPLPPKNKGGAPIGNHNALKHGFYSRKFSTKEIHDLGRQPQLEDEVNLLRVYIRRVAEQADSFTSLEQGMEFLRALSLSTYTLSRLLKNSKTGLEAADLLSRSMDEAIENIRALKNWK